LKTHNYAIATLSLKNCVLGSGQKGAGNAGRGNPLAVGFGGGMGGGGGGGARGGRGGGGGGNDKTQFHGGGARGINVNLAMMAPILHPSLAVIDGFEGMQGAGPIDGSRVDHRVCVVSPDWLAADCVGVALMGIDLANIGYLTYLANTGIGETDMSKMEIVGEPVKSLAKTYQLSPSIQQQFQWKNPARVQYTNT
jgi:hypothetical protein